MFKIRPDFLNWIKSHSGYNGGNLKANVWCSGIEYGGGQDPKSLLVEYANVPVNPYSEESAVERLK